MYSISHQEALAEPWDLPNTEISQSLQICSNSPVQVPNIGSGSETLLFKNLADGDILTLAIVLF
jgi:hypothetical protein